MYMVCIWKEKETDLDLENSKTPLEQLSQADKIITRLSRFSDYLAAKQ
jgi:hypothetical protein